MKSYTAVFYPFFFNIQALDDFRGFHINLRSLACSTKVYYLRVFFYHVIKNIDEAWTKINLYYLSKSTFYIILIHWIKLLENTHFNYARFQRISWRKKNLKYKQIGCQTAQPMLQNNRPRGINLTEKQGQGMLGAHIEKKSWHYQKVRYF